MKRNYFFKTVLTGSLVFAAAITFGQSKPVLQDNGKPVVINPVVTGADIVQSGCDSIKTTFAAGNGQSGIMFDAVAKTSLYLTTLLVSTTGSGFDTAYIYLRPGSCIGHDGSSAGWSLVSKMQAHSGGTSDTLIQVNTNPLNYNMVAGDTVGIYITYTGTLAVAYTNGTYLDSVYVQKSTIAVLQGYGKGYPAFGGSFSPRVFNGIVNFCFGAAGINEVEPGISASVFPNPMTSEATLSLPATTDLSNLQLVVTDISGRTVMVQPHLASHTVTINRADLSNGMYFYTLVKDGKPVFNGKLAVQ